MKLKDLLYCFIVLVFVFYVYLVSLQNLEVQRISGVSFNQERVKVLNRKIYFHATNDLSCSVLTLALGGAVVPLLTVMGVLSGEHRGYTSTSACYTLYPHLTSACYMLYHHQPAHVIPYYTICLSSKILTLMFVHLINSHTINCSQKASSSQRDLLHSGIFRIFANKTVISSFFEYCEY